MVKTSSSICKNGLRGVITIPPDKSISHRSLIFGALTKSKIKIKNLSKGADCLSTLKILSQLGVKYEFLSDNELILDSSEGFNTKEHLIFDCGNSGTSARLLTGLFSGIEGLNCTLIGDNSLQKRPMKRIIEPLSLMGADIESNDYKLPLKIKGKNLHSIEYHSPIPSAQVKSAIMLAGLNAQGITTIYEDTLSRNHSEIMFEYLKASISKGKDEKGYYTKIQKSHLQPYDIEIPGDISSAAFFIVAALIIPKSEIIIKNIGINPTRTGIFDVLEQIGANFKLTNKKYLSSEPVCDIEIKYTKNLKPFNIGGDLIPKLIDEIPILAVLASQIKGKSIVKDALDLRNKESDRISTIVNAFKSLDFNIEELTDGFIIKGGKTVSKSIVLKTYLDHRLAMSYYILGLLSDYPFDIQGFDCVNTSFPEFLSLVEDLVK